MTYRPKNDVFQQPEGKGSPIHSSPSPVRSSPSPHSLHAVPTSLLADELAREKGATMTELAEEEGMGQIWSKRMSKCTGKFRRDRMEELWPAAARASAWASLGRWAQVSAWGSLAATAWRSFGPPPRR